MIHLTRSNPASNMHRFYALDVQPDLFGQWCFIREWGRIGQPGQVRGVPYPTKREALAALDRQRRQTKTIEVLRCQYRSPCHVKGCTAAATTILRGLDHGGRPTVHWEVCTLHSDQAILREAHKGRNVVRLWTDAD